MITNNRIWVLGGVVVIVVVAALALLLGVKPQIDATLVADADRVNVETQNAAADGSLAALRTKFEQLGDFKSRLAELQKSIPATSNMGAVTTQLNAGQATYGVVVKNITVLDALPFAPSAEMEAAVPASITSANFTVIPITVQIAGKPAAMFEYIHGLQTGERLILVKGLTVTADNTIDISANVYVLTDSVVEPATEEVPTTESTAQVN